MYNVEGPNDRCTNLEMSLGRFNKTFTKIHLTNS